MTTTYYKKAKPKSNLVDRPPNLPKDFEIGSINVSMSLEQAPSGSISIEAIPVNEIEEYRKAYNRLDERIDIFDVPFIIKGYAEVVNRVHTSDGLGAEVFSISIQLNSWWESIGNIPVRVNTDLSSLSARVRRVSIAFLSSKTKVPYVGPYIEIEIPANADNLYSTSIVAELVKYSKLANCYINYNNPKGIELVPLDTGRVWELDDDDILYTIQSNVTNIPSFINAELGEFDTNPALRDRTLLEIEDRYVIEDPIITVIREGEDASVEPILLGGTLRDVSSAADRTGPRKSSKVTTLINGNVLREQVTTYAYIYTASDIIFDNQNEIVPMQKSSAGFWKILDQYTTQYLFEQASPESFTVQVKDRLGKFVTGYFIKSIGNQGGREGARFLVGSVTSGFKKSRFKKENQQDTRNYQAELAKAIADGETVDIAYYTALLNASKWRSIPYTAQERMSLSYYSAYYGILDNIPFSVDKIRPQDLTREVSNVSNYEVDADGFIYIVKLNPNYTPALFIHSSQSYSNSYASMPDPENILIKSEAVENNLDPQYIVYNPPLSTGEESETTMYREITVDRPRNIPGLQGKLTDRSFYTEYTKRYQAGDGEFTSGAMDTSFKEVPGKPPAASSYRSNYIPLNDLSQYRDTIKVNITSDLTTENTPSIGQSFSYPTLYIANALEAAETDLTIRHLINAYRETINIAFNYQAMRPGDYVDFYSNDTVLPMKRAIDVSYSLNYGGTLIDGTKLVTCDGTQVTLGEYRKRKITNVKQERIINKPNFNQFVNVSVPYLPVAGPAIRSIGAGRRV